ncbi:MAG: triosephosphate isomerase [Candidatus Roseilinea sp.]|nr:MAG: triosephosphate isomerase [Candidatus Roseilinea sp.]
MHHTSAQTHAFIHTLRERIASVPHIKHTALWVTPPFTSIFAVADAARGARVMVGAQNMHRADEGAFTGEISPLMLKACRAEFVMLGHAERCTLFGESNEALNRKALAAARHGLGVMLYEGEPVSIQQVGAGSVAADLDYVSVAFENIRRVLHELFGAASASMPILYGGSIDATNCARHACLPQAVGMGIGRAACCTVDGFVAVLTNVLAVWMTFHHESAEHAKLS